ncbi:MAG: TatD family hydrolase [Fibromonadaceae bacterium]|jgi:TatD DNase family protein|nr:TatD family hydrolase [Fibromonadaceae bacterium]
MNFIDTHCHIDTILEKTDGTIEALFEQMNPLPEAIVHIACDPKDFSFGKDFLKRKSINGVQIFGAFGVHPLNAKTYCKEAEAALLECLKLPNVVALGEIGLDYHYYSDNADLQKSVFLRQVEIGLELGKNFVFHLREAENDAFNILQKIDKENLNVHLHCYTGTLDFAEKVLSLKGNYFFGITGALTFEKTVTIKEAASLIPLNRMLLETDAPYLAPVPFRGKICTPAMIPNTAQVLADIKKVSLDELLKICRENTGRMYGI